MIIENDIENWLFILLLVMTPIMGLLKLIMMVTGRQNLNII